ncbi:hypothetical protein JI435_070040 [Parastagonospora nodorum SN15]|uniref:Uncharacterized protein n=1 Tax=Phaeosphaeria nodorum (strain SN15 / ATCC MYA-4574 / FGSC 10173) TaxID=321614 RepID=A0A7U2F847_PHANO|nr:hypothetical protein JI435_070040 [Parastagonospora nodorum SN15]
MAPAIRALSSIELLSVAWRFAVMLNAEDHLRIAGF